MQTCNKCKYIKKYISDALIPLVEPDKYYNCAEPFVSRNIFYDLLLDGEDIKLFGCIYYKEKQK